MNNRGFAITTILYGIMVLFCLLLVSLLGILSSYRKTQELLINENNGARNIVDNDVLNNEEEGNGLFDDERLDDDLNNYNDQIYTLTYDCGNGKHFNSDFSIIQVKYINGVSVDLESEYTCVRSGYTFIGWNTYSGASSKLNNYMMPMEDTTLYAVWNYSGNYASRD